MGDTGTSTKVVWEAYKKNKAKVRGLMATLRAAEEELAAQAAQGESSPSMFDQAVAKELALLQG